MKYLNLLLMVLFSFISMYVLMYMMVDKLSNVYIHLNQAYMAAVMTAPMITVELLLMGSMYTYKTLNKFLIFISLILLFIFIVLLRKQVAIDDKEFLRAMISHHGGAVLMAEQAKLTDPEIKELARTIIKDQNKEIEFMKSKL